MSYQVPRFWTFLSSRISRAWALPLLMGGCAAPMQLFGDRGSFHAEQPSKVAEHQSLDDHLAQVDAAGNQAGTPSLSERLRIPESLPGANVPPITLPPKDPNQPEAQQKSIDELFPALENVPAGLQGRLVSGDKPLSLGDLQNLAMTYNPLIAQADADIESAIGAAVQAGAHPNPTIGYEADTVGSAGTRNYQGVFFTQQIKTAGKLELARSAANVDLMNAQLAARKARVELITRIRSAYFAVLVARESIDVSEGLVRLTDEAFRVQVDQLKGGQAAAYEPMQLRVLAEQARVALSQAQNRYDSAWRQLAAALGVPELPPTPLDGRADLAVPVIDYDEALEHVLANNTDLLTARNGEMQARIMLRLAEVTPIPDVNVYSAIQKDFTTPPVTRTTYNLQIGVPVPIFDRNKGGIRNAQGNLIRSCEEFARVRNELTAQLAEAYERFQNNKRLIETYRLRVIPDQSRAYRAIYQRHQQEPERVGFGEVVVAQQALLNSITAYMAALAAQWSALNDVANLLQVESLDELNSGLLPATGGTQVPPPQ